MERRLQSVQSRATGHGKRTQRALEMCGLFMPHVIRERAGAGQKRGKCYACVGSDKKYSHFCSNCSRCFCKEHGTVTTVFSCDTSSSAAAVDSDNSDD